MKNIVATIIVIAALGLSVFAEGETPGGNRTCGGSGQPACFVQPADTDTTKDESESTIVDTIKIVKGWLVNLLG